MTLDEAKGRLDRMAKQCAEMQEEIDTLKAALPPPEKRTPGQTFTHNCPRAISLNAYQHMDEGERKAVEAGALAVLREHGPDFVFEKITPRDILEMFDGNTGGDDYLFKMKSGLLAKVKARLANG